MDRATGAVRLSMEPTGDEGEVLEVYRTADSGDALPRKAWEVAGEDLRNADADEWMWSDADAAAGGAASLRLYAVGRADVDADENGISDSREQLMHVHDIAPPARARWARAGRRGEFPSPTNIVNAKDFGATGNGVTDDSAAIKSAIKNVTAPGVVFLPAGTYRITQRFYLRDDVVLRGAGPALTRLVFAGPGTVSRCIGIAKWDSDQPHPWIAVTGGIAQASARIGVADAAGFAPGDIAEIEQDNESEWGFTDAWQASLRGQIVRITAVDPATRLLDIDRPLRLALDPLRSPRLRKLVVIRNAGIEDLYIERADAVDGYTIELKYAVNCWVRNVESYNTYKAHVWIERGFECEIRECYFHDSHVYGDGGQGYGVCCGRHTSDCLIEDNVFRHLRHSMIVGSGANGNVFGYNFSTNRALDPTWRTPQPDISVHGNYVYMNLFEGNVVEDADLPDYYHPAGPGNTLFRNRIVNRGEAVEVGSDGENILGNELPLGEMNIDAGVSATTDYGNNEMGVVTWPGCLCQSLPASLYRCVRPGFIPADEADVSWPPLGPGRPATAGRIPAQKRYESAL